VQLCKWFYKIKTKSDGFVERYKACLIANGYNQEYVIDYEETVAPVARLTFVRSLLLASYLCALLGYFQMDVKNTLINGDLSEEVYMQTPLGYTHSPHKIAGFVVPCMDWNKLYVLGFPNLGPLSHILGLFLAHMIMNFLFRDIMLVLFLF
jgi:hypothetical protein